MFLQNVSFSKSSAMIINFINNCPKIVLTCKKWLRISRL